MGLKPLDLAHWLDLDEHWLEERRLKAELLQHQRDRVFVSYPGTEVAQQEVLELVLEHLVRYAPGRYVQEGDRLSCSVAGETWDRLDYCDRPLELAGRLVQEDFCILAPASGYRLVAGCVCFPSRWDLRSKLGKSVFEIHDPVPHYAEALGNPVDHLFDRLRVDAPTWRLNWSLADTPDLFLPPENRPVESTDMTPETVGDRLWLRIEFQTLRRLPRTQTILFTIRTYCYSLAKVAADTALREGLQRAIAHLSPETQRYKSIEPIRTMLLKYLESPR